MHMRASQLQDVSCQDQNILAYEHAILQQLEQVGNPLKGSADDTGTPSPRTGALAARLSKS